MADTEVTVTPTPINPVEIKGAIAFSAEHARVWAEGTDEEVETLGGEHSAKGWSSLAEGEAKDYTDQQLAQARSEITTQINNATSNAVDVSKAYTDSQKLPATLSSIGLVKPDGNTTTVDTDGTIHAVSSGVLWGNISGDIADQTDLKGVLDGKQAALTAGSNITISDNTISATDTTYSAFTGADGAAAGTSGLVPAPAASDNVKYLKGDGTWAPVESLPTQTGQNGKFLTTDGTDASWATVDTLPSQSGNNGKFLTTNGSVASWAPVSAYPTLTWYTGNTGTTVTIVDTSSANLVKIYKNGVLLEPTADYSISGTTLTLITALVSTDKITVEVY